jgi:hypothetical protein
MIVAIHQPNLFPWLGFFDKILRSDRFVLLDSVQMPLTGSSYPNRVSVLIGGKSGAIQLPAARGLEARATLKNAPIAKVPKCREKILATVQQNYAKAPFAKQVLPILEPLILNPANTIGAYNEFAIRTVARFLGESDEKLVRASDLPASGSSTDLLISIVKAVGGDIYMAGGGAGGYQEDGKFLAAGMQLVYQGFRHPVYPQLKSKTFVPGLSIIDALMNLGFNGTRALLDTCKSKREP